MSSSPVELNDLQPTESTTTTRTAHIHTDNDTATLAESISQATGETTTTTSPFKKFTGLYARHLPQYGMLCLMSTLTLLGFFGALGHHLYYQSLHGHEGNDSQWPTRIGNGLSILVKTLFVASVDIAYKQLVWLILKRKDRGFTISTINDIFSADYDPLVYLDKSFYKESYQAAVIAALLWAIPLCAVFPPATLTVVNQDFVTPTTCSNIPMLDFTRENGFGLDSDDQERAGMSYWDIDKGFYTYASPSSELKRIFLLTAQSFTGPVKPPNPCQSSKSCSYSIDLAAPVYKCEDRQEFGGDKHFNRSQLLPTGNLFYASYSSFDEGDRGQALAWNASNTSNTSSQDIGVFTEIPSLWVGWVTQSNEYQPHIAECLLYNATTSYEISFSGDQWTTNRTRTEFISLLLSPGNSKFPQDDNYQQFSGYHAAGYIFRTWLSGTIISDPVAIFIDNTNALQSNLFRDTIGLPVSDDLAGTLEQLFRDYFLSMLGDTQLHSQVNLTVPCTVTNSVLVWHYDPFWLIFSYALALATAIIIIAIGAFCFYKNGYTMDTSFSTLVATTRSQDVDDLMVGYNSGQWPMPDDIAQTKLRLLESLDDNTRRLKFVFA
ncbi:hypothetical protein M426DRAFT_13586 [Hypoxylon sp. CI-4A]|nr:hypothetical protein M426DRAFT_13586 [Hypoxylon sp. CI-4A]